MKTFLLGGIYVVLLALACTTTKSGGPKSQTPATENPPKPPGHSTRTVGIVLEVVGGAAVTAGATTMTVAAVSGDTEQSNNYENAMGAGVASLIVGGAMFAAGYWLTAEADRLQREHQRAEAIARHSSAACKKRQSEALQAAEVTYPACLAACPNAPPGNLHECPHPKCFRYAAALTSIRANAWCAR